MQSQSTLAALAAGQHGVVSAKQMVGLGYSRSRISREVSAGRLHRIHQGVYAVGHPALSRHGRCAGAVLAGGEGALLSHASAAWLWGLTTRYVAVPEVTARLPRHTRSLIRIHSTTTLRSEDRSETDEIAVTAVPRTMLDATATGAEPKWLLARAERLGLFDIDAIDSLLQRCPGQRGAERLRHALADYRAPVFARSDLERRFLGLVKKAGLPAPAMNLFVAGYELDAYWPELRFAVELDTYDYHGSQTAFERDRLRQEDLKLAGIELTRITGRRIAREPRAVAKRLRQLLDQRHREMTPPSQG